MTLPETLYDADFNTLNNPNYKVPGAIITRTAKEAEELGGHDLNYWRDPSNYTPEQRAKILEEIYKRQRASQSDQELRNQATLELINNMMPERMHKHSKGAWLNPGNYTVGGDKYVSANPYLKDMQERYLTHKYLQKNGINNTILRRTRHGESLTPEQEDQLIRGYVNGLLNSATDALLVPWYKQFGGSFLLGLNNWFGTNFNANPEPEKYRPTFEELISDMGPNLKYSVTEGMRPERVQKITAEDITEDKRHPTKVRDLAQRANWDKDPLDSNNPEYQVQIHMPFMEYSNSPLTQSDEEDLVPKDPNEIAGTNYGMWKGVTHPWYSEAEVREKFPHRPDYHGMPLGEPDNPNSFYRGKQLRSLRYDEAPYAQSTSLSTIERRNGGALSSYGPFLERKRNAVGEGTRVEPTFLVTKEDAQKAGLPPIDLDFIIKVSQADNLPPDQSEVFKANNTLTQQLITAAHNVLNSPDKDSQLGYLKTFYDTLNALNTNNSGLRDSSGMYGAESMALMRENQDVLDDFTAGSIYGKGRNSASTFIRDSNPHAPWLFKKEWEEHQKNIVPGSPEDIWNKARPRYLEALERDKNLTKESVEHLGALQDLWITPGAKFEEFRKDKQAYKQKMRDAAKPYREITEKRRAEENKKRELERQKNKQQ